MSIAQKTKTKRITLTEASNGMLMTSRLTKLTARRSCPASSCHYGNCWTLPPIGQSLRLSARARKLQSRQSDFPSTKEFREARQIRTNSELLSLKSAVVLGLLAFDGGDYNLHTTGLIPKSGAGLTRVSCEQGKFVRRSCRRDPSPRM